ncbi:hypothetical protein LRR81_08005 [Metabacillus sp. GX 13764]|uniref:hypothetical protein n=1 Tax=Metabacillus kandeliae TaxID=2900151 RepID=UPI001E3A1127|nr:hypothetical protein [Metabacillus kandeliae]MCD7034174.1 hypothetical protein [Metabacillus kandeliae]
MLNTSINYPDNPISIIATLLAYCVIAYAANRIFQSQFQKPPIWKAMAAGLAGLFAININFPIMGTLIGLPILPLGAGIAYLWLKNREGGWSTYRRFIWLGFLSNFLFLAFSLLALGLFHVVYPENKPSTYLSNVERAAVVSSVPVPVKYSLDKESLLKQVHSFKEEKIQSDLWYEQASKRSEAHQRSERFPFLLTGMQSKWGSNFQPLVFVEKDGKGLLLTNGGKQYYFRTAASILKEDVNK